MGQCQNQTKLVALLECKNGETLQDKKYIINNAKCQVISPIFFDFQVSGAYNFLLFTISLFH